MDATLLSLSRWFPASATKRVKTKEQSAYTATSATASTAVARNTTIGNSTAATTWITAVTTRSMFIECGCYRRGQGAHLELRGPVRTQRVRDSGNGDQILHEPFSRRCLLLPQERGFQRAEFL